MKWGTGRYETAWAMLQKPRRAMARPDRDRLRDQVEADETYVGGREAGLRGGLELRDKALVVAADRRPSRYGALRPDGSASR